MCCELKFDLRVISFSGCQPRIHIMSTRVIRGPLKGYRRRKMVLDLDLNNAPPYENRDQEGPSTHPGSQGVQAGQQESSLPPAPIDVDALDDEVILSSPRAFQEARNNSRRDHGRTVVHDVDSEVQTTRPVSSTRNKRRRVPPNQTIINCDHYINLESNSNYKSEQSCSVIPSPPPPKEPTFSCPICMGPLVEEMSTKCGHIFCKACIKAAISAQSKCPTCRKKVSVKDIIRVYLPTTS